MADNHLALCEDRVRQLLRSCTVIEESYPSGEAAATEDLHNKAVKRTSEEQTTRGLSCSMCGVQFDTRQSQIEHVRLDWHRFNLRQRLAGRPAVTEDIFADIASDVSSISGSDSDDEADLAPHTGRQPISNARQQASDHQPSSRRGEVKVMVQYQDQVYSIWRALFVPPKTVCNRQDLEKSLRLLCSEAPQWTLLMLSAGHFAGAVFRGTEPVVHKTFHRYVVRAKRGTVQSVHDSQQGGHAARSAGASIRRYNEAALQQDISDLVKSWSELIAKSTLLFIRAPVYQRQVFFGSRTHLFDKDDNRLRTLPFPTRRPTFKELKRIHTLLSTVHHHGSVADLEAERAARQRARELAKQSEKPLSSEDLSAMDEGRSSPAACVTHHEKHRLKHPLHQVPPVHVCDPSAELDTPSSPSSLSVSEETVDLVDRLQGLAVELNESQSPRSKAKRKRRSSGKTSVETVSHEQEDPITVLGGQLLASCRSGNMALLHSLLLQASTPSTDGLSFCQKAVDGEEVKRATLENEFARRDEEDVGGKNSVLMAADPSAAEEGVSDEQVLFDIGGESVDVRPLLQSAVVQHLLTTAVGATHEHLLVVASNCGRAALTHLLMACGADPAIKDDKGELAYNVAADKGVRDEFRRFRALHPDRYNYTAAQIPEALTADMEAERQRKKAEKKKAQRQARNKKMKEKKAEEREKKTAEEERKWLESLTDRERRALAAEQRLQRQKATMAGGSEACAWCGCNLTGRVPFTKFDFKYCSMDCVREHRTDMARA